MGYLNRDKDRFTAADGDKDGKLNKTGMEKFSFRRLYAYWFIKTKEYGDFLHPEESKKMRDIVINVSLKKLSNFFVKNLFFNLIN
jgi:hypothetical protein